nr:hypothetical protein [Salinisphaera sp. LB1]
MSELSVPSDAAYYGPQLKRTAGSFWRAAPRAWARSAIIARINKPDPDALHQAFPVAGQQAAASFPFASAANSQRIAPILARRHPGMRLETTTEPAVARPSRRQCDVRDRAFRFPKQSACLVDTSALYKLARRFAVRRLEQSTEMILAEPDLAAQIVDRERLIQVAINEGFESGLSTIRETTAGRQAVDTCGIGVSLDHTVGEGIDQGTTVSTRARPIADLLQFIPQLECNLGEQRIFNIHAVFEPNAMNGPIQMQ